MIKRSQEVIFLKISRSVGVFPVITFQLEAWLQVIDSEASELGVKEPEKTL